VHYPIHINYLPNDYNQLCSLHQHIITIPAVIQLLFPILHMHSLLLSMTSILFNHLWFIPSQTHIFWNWGWANRHYHPSNACFFSFGDLPPDLETVNRYLLPFTHSPDAAAIAVEDEKRLTAPKTVHVTSPPGKTISSVTNRN
jgi:hypothetical protein